MIIRRAEEKDIAALSALAQKTYAETFGNDFSDTDLKDVLKTTKSEKAFENFIVSGDDFLVAQDSDEIIGYIGLQTPNFDMRGRKPTNKDQALKGIYVAKDHHRKGIGRQLMDNAFTQPRFQKAENIYLCVWEENLPAYNFYLNYGFKKVGTYDVIADGKVVGEDAVMMKAVI